MVLIVNNTMVECHIFVEIILSLILRKSFTRGRGKTILFASITFGLKNQESDRSEKISAGIDV